MSIPNIISIVRIALTPVFVVLYIKGELYPALGVLLLCGLSDVIDGAIARKYNMVTELGKMLDPFADKLIQAAMMVCAAVNTWLVWVLLGLHVIRELTLMFVGLKVIKTTGKVYSSKWYGKLCTVAIYVVMIACMAFPEMPEAVIYAGVLICAALVLMCFVLYFANYMQIMREFRKNNSEA